MEDPRLVGFCDDLELVWEDPGAFCDKDLEESLTVDFVHGPFGGCIAIGRADPDRTCSGKERSDDHVRFSLPEYGVSTEHGKGILVIVEYHLVDVIDRRGGIHRQVLLLEFSGRRNVSRNNSFRICRFQTTAAL